MTSRGQVALITGASSGIGLAIARHRIDRGDRVLITGRTEGPLRAASTALGASAQYLVCDAAAPDAGDRMVAAAMDRFGRVDILVPNAAHVPALSTLADAADADIERVWQTNVAGPLRLVRAALRGPFRDRPGTVVMIGSLGGQSLQPDMGLYGASKAALHHLTRTLAAELGPAVRVNAVAPGLVRTDGARAGWEAAEATIRARSPLGRLGEVDDIADAVDMLVDDTSRWITGQILVVDGGASVQLARRTARTPANSSVASS